MRRAQQYFFHRTETKAHRQPEQWRLLWMPFFPLTLSPSWHARVLDHDVKSAKVERTLTLWKHHSSAEYSVVNEKWKSIFRFI